MGVMGFDAFQHWFWRQSEKLGPLTTGCGNLRGDTPIVLEVREKQMQELVNCYAIEGNGARPSHQGDGYSDDGKMYTLNTIEKHAVSYGLSRSLIKGGNGSNGGMPIGENIQPTMQANGAGSVCFQIGGPRNAFCETDKSRTLDTACLQPACNEGGMAIVYPKRTGALCANSHPGSYTGQDAFNDMLPVIKEDKKYVVRRLTPVEC